MSIMANDKIIGTLRERFSETLPLRQMETVLSAVADVISGYEITEIFQESMGEDCFLDAFLNAIRVEGRSEKTLHRYEYVIRRFLDAMKCTSNRITAYHVRQYLAEEKNRGISDGTIRGMCWVFSSFFGWLHRDGLINKNPMANIGKIKCQKKVKEILSKVDIEKLKNGAKTVRDKAIICMMKATGCRVAELCGLNRGNVNMNSMECKVLGKGNKERIVYIDSVTCMVLQEYLDSRKDDDPALFMGQKKNRITPSGIRNMLRQTAKRVGVKGVHPHKFRRTEITELVARGMPIEQVAKLVGHERLDTTMEYLVIDQTNVKNNYAKYA